MYLTTRIIRNIAKIGQYIQSEHIKYWKMFHLHNAKQLNRLTLNQPIVGLQKNQIQTRILKILHQSQLVDIKDFTFQLDLRKDLYLDSLSLTVLITSIQQQFNTIFDDDDQVYEGVRNLGQVVQILMKDQTIL